MPIRVYRRENAKPAEGEPAKAKTSSLPGHALFPDAELDDAHAQVIHVVEFTERYTRNDRAIYNRAIGVAECAWLEHAVAVTTTTILVVGRDKTFVAIDGPRPVSMHENDRATSALSALQLWHVNELGCFAHEIPQLRADEICSVVLRLLQELLPRKTFLDPIRHLDGSHS